MSQTSSHHLVVQERGLATVAQLKDPRPSDEAVWQIGDELCQIAKDCQNLVIDFSAVKFFEANLRGQLVQVYKVMESQAGRLAVCHLPPGMKEHFRAIRFDQFLLVVDTLEETLHELGATGREEVP